MSNDPKVSICVPNLNTVQFLRARFASIQQQTLTDWEAIVTDNYSDDGAWEFFQAVAATDNRIRIEQAPRRGMYANWNNCLQRARGDHIYIATSDDTMTPECLASLSAALDHNPRCGIAVCRAMAIDRRGLEVPHWWPTRESVRFFGPWMQRPHIRPAPHDGILHGVLGTVYDSITQVLIRRTFLHRIGLFREDFGSIADFEWGMRASLTTDVVFVPQTLATWRMHPEQATRESMFARADVWDQVTQMIGLALGTASRVAPEKTAGLSRSLLQHYFSCVAYQLCLARARSTPGKILCLAIYGRHLALLRRALVCRRRGKPFSVPNRRAWAQKLLRKLQAPALVPL